MKSKKLGLMGSLFMGIIFTAIGGGLTYFDSWPDFQMARESVHWPKTTGIIEISEVVTSESSMSSRKSRNTTNYSANIKYSYTVTGRRFVSYQIYVGSEGQSTSFSSDAYEYTSKYPVGRQVEVSYSPILPMGTVRPREAVLETGLLTPHYIFLGGSLIFLFVGVLLVLSSLMKITTFAASIGVFGSLLTKRDRNHESSLSNHQKLKKPHPQGGGDINRNDEMATTNKVAIQSKAPANDPSKYKWIIKTSKKEYGPYSYEDLVTMYDKGKIEGRHECYAQGTNSLIKISSIISKKAS